MVQRQRTYGAEAAHLWCGCNIKNPVDGQSAGPCERRFTFRYS